MPPTAVGLITTSPLATCLARRYVFSYVLACYELTIHFVTICVYLHLWQPLPPGEKRKKEGWENIWYVGMYGSMLLAGVLLYYKPDTRCVRFYDISTLNAYSELQLVDMGVQRSKAKDGGAGGEDRLSLICICIRVACRSFQSYCAAKTSYYCVLCILVYVEAVKARGNQRPSRI